MVDRLINVLINVIIIKKYKYIFMINIIKLYEKSNIFYFKSLLA